jgi:integrase
MVNDLVVSKFKADLRSQTVKNVKHCLSSVLQHAHSPDGYIERNPVRGVKVPKPENESASREPDPFSWEDRTTLEKTFEQFFPREYPMILTGFRTGLRIGELLALQWGDIDFKHRLIRVCRNIATGRVTTPKSRSSVRDVRMTKQLIEALRELQKKRKEETLKKGWPEVPEWIFCNTRGGVMNADNFRKRIWEPAMRKSGLRRRTPHDMRHTYATLRLSKGDSLAEVSKEMGHGSAEITYRTYYKWLPKESRTDIDELDNPQPSATYTQPNPTQPGDTLLST